MTNHIFTSVIGVFILDEHDKIKKAHIFKDIADYKERNKIEAKLKEEFEAKELEPKRAYDFLKNLTEKEHIESFRKINLAIAKEKVKQSVNEDNLIGQAINSIAETEKVANLMTKRLREWYSLYNPEFSEAISNHEKFTELIQRKSKQELLREIQISDSMGADLKDVDVREIMELAKQVDGLFKYKENLLSYIEKIMDKYCPNLKAVAGVSVGAKLIEHTGSLRRLVMLPASTIQVLGAEKALFRHIKTGARPPKYGLIFEHKYIQTGKRSEQGKRARALADKISMAVRLDYFKGAYMGDKLNRQLEEKFR